MIQQMEKLRERSLSDSPKP